MSERPSAIGYLRKDISRDNQKWDESLMRTAAGGRGYNLRKTMAVSSQTETSVQALAAMLDRVGAAIVVTPALSHFDDRVIPAGITRLVLTVDSNQIYDPTAWEELLTRTGDQQ
ncbi:hypothetical protein ACWDYH_31440 [Nocardia goodfellowii]